MDLVGAVPEAEDRAEVSNLFRGIIKGERKMKKWILIGVIAAVVLAALYLVGIYNNLVSLDQSVKQAWAQVENQLQRRNDLIPNLVSTVKGYAKHEKSIFENVAAARAKLAGTISSGSVQDKIDAANGLNSALGRLLAIAENYPNLKASETFTRLMDELSGTENRIAVERMRYNQNVQNYNTIASRIPTVMFVKTFGFNQAKPYFEAPEAAKAVPKVTF